MPVVLVGVGADGTNTDPVPSLNTDGTYDYIPIPETTLTTESRTYGSLELLNQGGTAADYVEKIKPFDSDGDWITDNNILQNHPFHFDPDFEAMTFGDSRKGTGSTLANNLSEGDGLGFYTGLRGPDGHLHRYIYGFFTVNEIADLSELDRRDYHDRLHDFPENAHAKRLEARGKPKHYDLVIADGREPAVRFDEPVKISRRRDNRPPTYELRESIVEKLDIQNGVIAMDRKPALVCDLSPDAFLDRMQELS